MPPSVITHVIKTLLALLKSAKPRSVSPNTSLIVVEVDPNIVTRNVCFFVGSVAFTEHVVSKLTPLSSPEGSKDVITSASSRLYCHWHKRTMGVFAPFIAVYSTDISNTLVNAFF